MTQVERDSIEGPRPPTRRRARPVDWSARGWLAVWFVVAGVVVLPHLFAYTSLSRVDEFQHVDYLDKVQHLELVGGGEKIGETAMREQACRGMHLPGLVLPPCSTEDLRPEQFPGAGFNHTYGDPPTYYALTGLVAAGVERLPGVDSLVTAGRSVGWLWLGGGLAATFFLALALGARTMAAAGVTLLVASTPIAVEAVATVTTDAPGLLVGAVVCLVALRVAEKRRSVWWLIPAAAFVTAIKPTNLVVIGAVLVFLLVQPRRADRASTDQAPTDQAPTDQASRDPDRADRLSAGATATAPRRAWGPPKARFLAPFLLVAAAAVPTLTWMLVSNSIKTPAVEQIEMFAVFESHGLELWQLADNLFATMSPIDIHGANFVPEFLYVSRITALAIGFDLLLVAGVAGLAWFGPWRAQSTRMAFATLTSMLVSGPVLVVLIYLSLDSYYIIPGRYGLSLLAPAAACLAVAASRKRVGEVGVLALGLLSLTMLLTRTV